VRKLNELEVRKEYQIEITNRFVALENLGDDDITRAWENIEENIRTAAKDILCLQELKQHKPWFDECLGCLDHMKQAELQWLQDPRQNNVDNLNNVSPDGSRHFRQIKKKYVKAIFEELETKLASKILRTCIVE